VRLEPHRRQQVAHLVAHVPDQSQSLFVHVAGESNASPLGRGPFEAPAILRR
jgi:hypothetical protein